MGILEELQIENGIVKFYMSRMEKYRYLHTLLHGYTHGHRPIDGEQGKMAGQHQTI